MLRRMIPTLVVLALGVAALLWGLGSLERIFMDERDQAYERVAAERNAMQEYARRTLEQMVEARLHDADAQIEVARTDPLMSTTGLLLFEDGRQIFPRQVGYAGGADTPARRLYLSLLDGSLAVQREPDTPWDERVLLFQDFQAAVRSGREDQIREAFHALLRHRARHVINSTQDIPLRLATLDFFIGRSDPNKETLADLLRDGLGDSEPPAIEGLQPALLRRRGRFTIADFQFLSGRVIDLSARVQARADDFRSRAAEPVTVALPVPRQVAEPSLVLGGTWYVRPAGPDRVIGVAVSVAERLEEIEAEMRARALLEPGDVLMRPALPDAPVALATLPLAVESPRFGQAMDDADRNFWLKTTFVALSAVLALVIFALAFVLQTRKQRFLALKSDFVATVSHELRTPLASVRLMAETLERRTAGLAAARDYPTRIVDEIDELTFLVDNILSFNRLDKGRWRPLPEPVLVRELVDEIEPELHLVGGREVIVKARELDDVVLNGDRELIKLLLRNLMKNACTYNDRTPIEIVLRGERKRSGFALSVRDNGVGIPASEHGRVFADFYRPTEGGSSLGRPAGKAARGSGLGLAICRKTMEAHGGGIRIANSGLEGTTFELMFPRSMMM